MIFLILIFKIEIKAKYHHIIRNFILIIFKIKQEINQIIYRAH